MSDCSVVHTLRRVIDFDPTRPKWEQIADVVRGRIASGEYPPNHKLSEVKLEGEFGVARVTIRKVTAALRDDGLIVTTPGMGSFVLDRPPSPGPGDGGTA